MALATYSRNSLKFELVDISGQHTSMAVYGTAGGVCPVLRDGHELLRNVIDYITHYMLKIVF